METTLAIVVLVVVLLLLGALVYFYARASGRGALRAWFVAPASIRQTFGGLLAGAEDAPRPSSGRAVHSGDTEPLSSERDTGSVTLAYDETALAVLRKDLERELNDTQERQREIDLRLQRVDVALGEMRSVPDDLTNMMRLRDRRTKRQLAQLRHELEGVRRGATSAGARRDEAYAELYNHLAQIEASLATAINPMLLPGEPIQVPNEFVPETLERETWDDVGEHAYAFGMRFTQTRLVLEPELAQDIETFLATLRQALTGKVYPTVRRNEPTRSQLAQMRVALESVVEVLTPVRRQLERAWYELDRPTLHDYDDEIDPNLEDDDDE